MNKKNWLVLFLACAVTLTAFNSCKKSDDEDTTDTGPTEWTRSTVFTGDPRSNAASFQIGSAGYLVGGMVGSSITTPTRVNDAWTFNNGAWSKIADFTGTARQSAVGFAIDGKGFVGTGHDGANALVDFYAYDPSANTWTAVADFPGEARYGAVAFSLGGYGYVGLGATATGKTLSDFYRYNPQTNTWTTVATNFKRKRVNAFAFVIGNKAYVGGGIDNNEFPEDFYSYDGTTWTELNPINRSDDDYTYDLTRQSPATFTIGSYGYVVGGKKFSVLGNVWKYQPESDSWTDKHQAFQGSYREGAVAFSIDGNGYVATGINSSSSRFDDNWKFTPVR